MFSYWKASLDMLTLADFRLFALATLNNVRRSLTIICQQFIWLVFGALGLSLWANQAKASGLVWAVWLALSFIYVLVARPSVERKDRDYLIKYLPYFLGYGAILTLYRAIAFFSGSSVLLAMAILPALSVLFYLDSSFSIIAWLKSIVRSFRCIAYLSPAFLVLNVLVPLALLAIVFIIYSALGFFLPAIIQAVIIKLSLWLWACVCISGKVIFYAKVKHTYHSFLFNE